jgi:beta-alanine--pyruvate transaminase
MAENTALALQPDLPDLEAHWMPFTGNRYFKKHPRVISRASGMHCYTHDGKELLDAVAGLWCCNAGHCHPKIVEAIKEQAETLDYSMTFQPAWSTSRPRASIMRSSSIPVRRPWIRR